jgi:hypothetical protein
VQRSPAPLMQVNCSGNGQRTARQPARATGASIKHRSSRCSRVPAAACSSACSLAETRLGAPRRRFPRGCSGQRAELPSRRCGSRSRVGPKHFRCPRQRSSTVSVRPTHLPDTAAEGHGPSSGFSMRPQRRTYSKSFKESQVIQECSEPGASIANIALGYSLNAALLNKSNFC